MSHGKADRILITEGTIHIIGHFTFDAIRKTNIRNILAMEWMLKLIWELGLLSEGMY